MTSNIDPSVINTLVPVPNSDNPSQDLRNNFSQIRSQFQVAAQEIGSLQATTIQLTGPIQSDPVTLNTDPAGTLLITRVATTDLAQVFQVPGTSALQMPVGRTAQRPAGAPLPPARGMIRYNTDLEAVELYQGFNWVPMAVTGPTGVGGPTGATGPQGTLATPTVSAPIVAGTVTIDLSTGDFFYTTIDANITTFDITNAVDGSTFMWQTIGTGVAYTQNFGAVLWPSGGSPVLTVANGKVDTYVFIYRNNWYAYVSGQNS